MGVGRFSGNYQLDVDLGDGAALAGTYDRTLVAAVQALVDAGAAALAAQPDERRPSALTLTFQLQARSTGRFALVPTVDNAHVSVTLSWSGPPPGATPQLPSA